MILDTKGTAGVATSEFDSEYCKDIVSGLVAPLLSSHVQQIVCRGALPAQHVGAQRLVAR